MPNKYAVVVCPNCKKAKIIEKDKKSTTCPFCNKKHLVKHLKIQYETNSQQKARAVIGLIHARQQGKEEEFRDIISK